MRCSFYFFSTVIMHPSIGRRGTTLAEFLIDVDPQGKLKKCVSELLQFDPKGLDDCKKKKLLVALSSYVRFTRRKRILYSCLKLDTELCWNQKSVPVPRQLQEYKWMWSFSCYVSLFMGGFAVDSYMPLLMDVDKTEHNLWD